MAQPISSAPLTLFMSAVLLFVTLGPGRLPASAFSLLQTDLRQTLAPGPTVEGEVSDGRSQVWQVNLSAGDYLHVWFGREVILDARLFAPSAEGGEKKLLLSVKDRGVLYEGRQNLDLHFVAESSGLHTLEIARFGDTGKAAPGRYKLRIEALRVATPEDKLRINAESALVEGELFIGGDVTADRRQRGIARYDEALAIWQRLGERKEELRTAMMLGRLYLHNGEPQKAQEYVTRAIQIARDLGDQYQAANLTMSIGTIESTRGNYEKALEAYQQARQLFAGSAKKLGEAAAINAIGKTYLSLGEVRTGLDYLQQALQAFSAFGTTSLVSESLNNVGLAHRQLGENHEALRLHERALETAIKLEEVTHEATSLGHLGDTHLALGDRQSAVAYYARQLDLCQRIGHRMCTAAALGALGDVAFKSGDMEKSLDYLGRSLTLSRQTGARAREAGALYALARTNHAIGNLEEARPQIEAALDIQESIRTSLTRQDLRASFFSSAQSGFDLYIELLMSLHSKEPAAGLDAAALEASERARARSLLDQLALAGADIREGASRQLLESERKLRQRLTAKAVARANALNQKSTETLASVFDREIADLTARYRVVETEIRATSPRYAALTRPEPLTAAQIRRLLDHETVLLEFALGEFRSFVWAVTSEAIVSRQLPARVEIESATREVYDLLIARQSRAGSTEAARAARIGEADARFQGVALRLSGMLLGPLAKPLRSEWKGKRLVVVASGALEYLPFAALPAPSNGGAYRPLIADHEILNLPSASVLSVIRREAATRAPAPKMVAVLADPVFDAADPRLLAAKRKAVNKDVAINTRSDGDAQPSAPGSTDDSPLHRAIRSTDRGRLSRLPFSREEAESIASLAPATSLLKATDFRASRAMATSGELSNYRIVHFATHGLLNSEHPELSGLVLSLVDENGKAQDGFLRMHEIYNLRLPADVVVLSACQTGLGKEIRGEGLVGLTRGFMYAGAKRVVASLWQVDDLATAELMKRFYRGMLKDDLRPAAALRAAQLEMMNQKRWSSPYFWGAFVIQGEWR